MEYAATLEPKCHPTAVKKKGAAAGPATGGSAKKEESWRDLPVGKRLAHGLIKVCVQLVACPKQVSSRCVCSSSPAPNRPHQGVSHQGMCSLSPAPSRVLLVDPLPGACWFEYKTVRKCTKGCGLLACPGVVRC